MNFHLVTYPSHDGLRAGLAANDVLYDIAQSTKFLAWVSLDAVIADWERAEQPLRNIAEAGGELAQVNLDAPLAPPLLQPGAIFCAGANYKDHVIEMATAQGIAPEPDPHDVGLKAWHFIKLARCLAANGDIIHLPRHAKRVDYEAELAVIIGRKAKNISLDQALSHVAGYAVANDLSARDLGKRNQVPDQSPFKWDWVAHKAFDQSCPLGPGIVPASAIADPQNLDIELWLNGEIRQRSNTREMIFTVAEQIAHLSEKVTLMPGDIILTGTPAGVGTPRGEFLKPGDEVRIRIEGIGEITNRMA